MSMEDNYVEIIWPNGRVTKEKAFEDWFSAASRAKLEIPTGCLGGSCGACEIEVNGEIHRPCIGNIPNAVKLKVEFASDPYW